MSGHSKWASIKHKKAIVDSRRGQQFTKLARAITVAARDGGGDPDSNATLANAVQKARDASMPKDNIERAIAKGTGEGVRHIFGQHGGALGEPGSVAYLFEKHGVVVVDAARWSEDDLEPAIDAGAQDIAADGDLYEI